MKSIISLSIFGLLFISQTFSINVEKVEMKTGIFENLETNDLNGGILEMTPETKITISGMTLTADKVLYLLQYSQKVMKKCGENFEFCMIKDGKNLQDEVSKLSEDLGEENLDLSN